MTIIQRVRSQLTDNAASKAKGLIGAYVPAGILRDAAGLVVNAAANGGKLGRDSLKNLAAGEFNRQIGALGVPAGVQDALGIGAPAYWAPAQLLGSLTIEKQRKQFAEAAMLRRSWKNLFHIRIDELRASKESPGGAGPINLLAVDVNFGAITMPGEAVPIGGANIDNLSGSDRTELRLTTYDDERGSIYRWFAAKADQAVRTDGTFGIPAEYLVVITVTQMTSTGEGDSKDRMRHRFLMRPSSAEVELSRRAAELQELALSFVEFDTFMESA